MTNFHVNGPKMSSNYEYSANEPLIWNKIQAQVICISLEIVKTQHALVA